MQLTVVGAELHVGEALSHYLSVEYFPVGQRDLLANHAAIESRTRLDGPQKPRDIRHFRIGDGKSGHLSSNAFTDQSCKLDVVASGQSVTDGRTELAAVAIPSVAFSAAIFE